MPRVRMAIPLITFDDIAARKGPIILIDATGIRWYFLMCVWCNLYRPVRSSCFA